jgi:hypothetical protein
MSIDLYKNGYMPGYEMWVHHSEDPPPHSVLEVKSDEEGGYDRMKEMFDDVWHEILPGDFENPPQTLRILLWLRFELLKASEEMLHEHMKVRVLVFVTQLMAIKYKFGF